MKRKLKIDLKKETDLNFKNGELFNRMNYLIKLSSNVFNKMHQLSKVYSHMAKDISKRNAIRIDSKVKKLICGSCCNNLYLDKASHLDVKNKAGKHCLEIMCSNCHKNCEIILF